MLILKDFPELSMHALNSAGDYQCNSVKSVTALTWGAFPNKVNIQWDDPVKYPLIYFFFYRKFFSPLCLILSPSLHGARNVSLCGRVPGPRFMMMLRKPRGCFIK